LIKNSDSKFT